MCKKKKKKQVCLFYHNNSKVRVQLSWKNLFSHMKCPVSLFPAMAEDFSFWTRILITLMKMTMLTWQKKPNTCMLTC